MSCNDGQPCHVLRQSVDLLYFPNKRPRIFPMFYVFLSHTHFHDLSTSFLTPIYIYHVRNSLLRFVSPALYENEKKYSVQVVVIVYVLFISKYRKHSFLIIMLVAAIITPPDLMTLILVTIPLYLLYEISIRVTRWVER